MLDRLCHALPIKALATHALAHIMGAELAERLQLHEVVLPLLGWCGIVADAMHELELDQFVTLLAAACTSSLLTQCLHSSNS